jgi:hypothetical protein
MRIIFLFFSTFNFLSLYAQDITVISKQNYHRFNVEISTGTLCEITGSGVRMRETPSLKGRIIGSFSLYETVELIRMSNDRKWCRVQKSDGTVGWVSADYIGDCWDDSGC